MTREDRIKSESKYQRAAAEWVARHNRSKMKWATDEYVAELNARGEPNIATADYITDVNFEAAVGAYAYSELTFDDGGLGVTYKFWERTRPSKKNPTGRDRAIDMDVRFYGEMNAGTFVEECVALLEVV